MVQGSRNVKRSASRKPVAGRKPSVKKQTRAALPVAMQEREVMQYSLVMEKQCTVREAEAFKLALQTAEDSSGDFTLEAGAVERIDTAGLQLLLGFAARLRLIGRPLVWTAVSPTLRQGARQLGIDGALGLPEASA
jgi:anti-anti-sigma regulatory factor